jgi:hypothetical protein
MSTKMTTRRRSSQTTSLRAWQSCDSACELCLSKRTQHCAHACMPGYVLGGSQYAPQMSETLSCSNMQMLAVSVRARIGANSAVMRSCGQAHPHTLMPSYLLHWACPSSHPSPHPHPLDRGTCTLDTPQRNLRHLFVKVDNFDACTKHKTS